jgi:long-chain acyl-CoA synthetase
VAPVWAKEQGIAFRDFADLATKPELQAAIEAGIEESMARFAQAERVKKVAILSQEWQPDSDELTPTSKLKRRTILAKYADQIEALYS